MTKAKNFFVLFSLCFGLFSSMGIVVAEKLTSNAFFGVADGKKVLVVDMYGLSLKKIEGSLTDPQANLEKRVMYHDAFEEFKDLKDEKKPTIEYLSAALSPLNDKVAVSVRVRDSEKWWPYVLVYNVNDLTVVGAPYPLKTDELIQNSAAILGFSHDGNMLYIGTNNGFYRKGVSSEVETQRFAQGQAAVAFASLSGKELLVTKKSSLLIDGGLVAVSGGGLGQKGILLGTGDDFIVGNRARWAKMEITPKGKSLAFTDMKLGLTDNGDACQTPKGLYLVNDSGVYLLDVTKSSVKRVDSGHYSACFNTAQGLGVITMQSDFKILPFLSPSN